MPYTDDEKADIRAKFQDLVNMGPAEFDRWADDPCSREASVDRRPIRRLRRLLGTPMSEWSDSDYEQASKVIAFISRMREVEGGKAVSEECPLSPRDISLLNWGYDPRKSAVVKLPNGSLALVGGGMGAELRQDGIGPLRAIDGLWRRHKLPNRR